MIGLKQLSSAAASTGGAKVHAEPLPARRALTLGSKQYEVLSEKRMSNSTIYRALDDQGREVAIKELELGRLLDNPKIFDLAKREAGILQSIDHPGVVKCLDYHSDQAEGKFFIVNEWIEGKTLKEFRDGEGRLTDDQVNDLTSKVLDVVSYLHTLNPPVIHRDLKPENVMLCQGGSIKVVDFGFSVSDRGTGTTFCAINSFGFTAPEVAQGSTGDRRSDLFSIGAIYLWFKTGKDAMDLRDMGTFELKLPDSLAAADRRFLEQALAYIPNARFQDAGQMKVSLLGIDNKAVAVIESEAEHLAKDIHHYECRVEDHKKWMKKSLKEGLTGTAISSIAGALGCVAAFHSKEAWASISFSVALTLSWYTIKEIRDYRRYKKSLKQIEAELKEKRLQLQPTKREPTLLEHIDGLILAKLKEL